MTATLAPEIYNASTAEVVNCLIDFRGKLDVGELLTGTPTVTENNSPNHLSISSKAVNSQTITLSNGDTLAAGEAVTFRVTLSGATANTLYTITAVCGTTSTPAQTRDGACRIYVTAA